VSWPFWRLHHRCVIFSVVYVLVRCLFQLPDLLAGRGAFRKRSCWSCGTRMRCCRRPAGRVGYQPADRLWLAALSRLIPATGGARCSP